MAYKVDPYADIDFEEINDQTNLATDEIKCLKNCFDLFDTKKQDFLSADDLGEVLRAMGFRPSQEELMDILFLDGADLSHGTKAWAAVQPFVPSVLNHLDLVHRIQKCLSSWDRKGVRGRFLFGVGI